MLGRCEKVFSDSEIHRFLLSPSSLGLHSERDLAFACGEPVQGLLGALFFVALRWPLGPSQVAAEDSVELRRAASLAPWWKFLTRRDLGFLTAFVFLSAAFLQLLKYDLPYFCQNLDLHCG